MKKQINSELIIDDNDLLEFFDSPEVDEEAREFFRSAFKIYKKELNHNYMKFLDNVITHTSVDKNIEKR